MLHTIQRKQISFHRPTFIADRTPRVQVGVEIQNKVVDGYLVQCIPPLGTQ